MMPNVLGAAHVPDIAVFVVGALMVLAGALGVVVSRSPIRAALSLVVTLFGIAILFVAQDADFLAVVQVVVYAGAIVVLFLFVIMLLGVDKTDRPQRDPIPLQRIVAPIVGAGMLTVLLVLTGLSWDATAVISPEFRISGIGSNVQKLADAIFTTYLFPFEGTSLLLVIAVIGAVVLARRPRSSDDVVDLDDVLVGEVEGDNEVAR
jgi:NADH-quinone oxidoreductase subunit J